DSANSQLRELLLSVRHALANAASYNAALQAAEGALKSGDLSGAKAGIKRAMAAQSLDMRGKLLEERIAREMELRTSKEKVGAERQFALTVNLVEKTIADARMLLYLRQNEQASQALEKVADKVAV